MFKKLFHFLVVAGENKDELSNVIFHFRKKKIQDLTATGITWADQLVCLIDKKRPASFGKHLVNLLLDFSRTIKT